MMRPHSFFSCVACLALVIAICGQSSIGQDNANEWCQRQNRIRVYGRGLPYEMPRYFTACSEKSYENKASTMQCKYFLCATNYTKNFKEDGNPMGVIVDYAPNGLIFDYGESICFEGSIKPANFIQPENQYHRKITGERDCWLTEQTKKNLGLK